MVRYWLEGGTTLNGTTALAEVHNGGLKERQRH